MLLFFWLVIWTLLLILSLYTIPSWSWFSWEVPSRLYGISDDIGLCEGLMIKSMTHFGIFSLYCLVSFWPYWLTKDSLLRRFVIKHSNHMPYHDLVFFARRKLIHVKINLIFSDLFSTNCFLYVLEQIMWTFSLYLEAVAILPQLVLLQRTKNIDNLTGQYVFFLGWVLNPQNPSLNQTYWNSD